ncbi:hypothetical protein ACSBR1_004175 [Camellia fascicularis]
MVQYTWVFRALQRDRAKDPRGDRAVRLYDWGGAGLATLYGYRSSTSRKSGNRLWVYAYFLTLAPESEVEMPPVVPYSHRYDDRCFRGTRETFPFFRRSLGSLGQRCLRESETSLPALKGLLASDLCLRTRYAEPSS